MIDIAGLADGLREEAPGFWVAADTEEVSFPVGGHRACLAVEESSFWFNHRNACITAIVRRWPPTGPVFDVGGGNGYVSAGLNAAGYPAVLVEPGRDGAENGRRRGLPCVVCATVGTARFRAGRLPAVGLFDVLEHIDDDLGFLRDLHAALEPGGRLYLAVPAHRWLWSIDDVVAGHFRRYTERTLARVVAAAGFEVDFVSYYFAMLPLPVLLVRSIPSLLRLRKARPAQPDRDHTAPGGTAGRLLDRLLARERTRLETGRVRFGSSVILAAHRP